MKATEQYYDRIQHLMRRVFDEESGAIQRAAEYIANAIADDRLLHVFGTGGHSAMGAEELFYRSGGLVPVNAILDSGVLLAHGAARSTGIERTPGYAGVVLDDNDVGRGDVLLIVNAYGVNAASIEAAIGGRERGCTTVAVTSVELQRTLPPNHPSRHPSGQNLCELVDVVVDCKVPMGDALVSIPEVNQPVGPCSTFLNALTLNLISIEVVTRLAERGSPPPIWKSANSPGGDEANIENIRRYKHRLKRL